MIKNCRRALLIAFISLPTFAAELNNASAAEKNENTAVTISMLGPALRSSDLERSTQYYENGLGMTLATTLKHGTVTEAIFSFGPPSEGQSVIMLFKDEAADKSPKIEHGNGFGRIVLRASNVKALAARLIKAGYSAGEIHEIPANRTKVLLIEDLDGYKYEIVERDAAKQ